VGFQQLLVGEVKLTVVQHRLLQEQGTAMLLIDITNLNLTLQTQEGMEIVRVGIADFKTIRPSLPFLIQAQL
jgi:hypothetical protein